MTKRLRILRDGIQRASRYVNSVGMFSLLVIMFITVGDVLLRNLLRMPIPGVYELTGFLLAIFVLLGVAYTQQVDGHVRITFLFFKMPLRLQRYVEGFTTLLSVPFLAIITWQGWVYAKDIYRSSLTSGVLHIPEWPFASLVAVGGGLLCLEFLITFVDCVQRLARKKEGRKAEV